MTWRRLSWRWTNFQTMSKQLYFQFIWILVGIPKCQQIDMFSIYYFVVENDPFMNNTFINPIPRGDVADIIQDCF